MDTWGEKPFFHPLPYEANFIFGAFGADGPALPCKLPRGRKGGGGGVGVKGPGSVPPLCLQMHKGLQLIEVEFKCKLCTMQHSEVHM